VANIIAKHWLFTRHITDSTHYFSLN